MNIARVLAVSLWFSHFLQQLLHSRSWGVSFHYLNEWVAPPSKVIFHWSQYFDCTVPASFPPVYPVFTRLYCNSPMFLTDYADCSLFKPAKMLVIVASEAKRIFLLGFFHSYFKGEMHINGSYMVIDVRMNCLEMCNRQQKFWNPYPCEVPAILRFNLVWCWLSPILVEWMSSCLDLWEILKSLQNIIKSHCNSYMDITLTDLNNVWIKYLNSLSRFEPLFIEESTI